jgi:predicted ATP-dependent serine protease
MKEERPEDSAGFTCPRCGMTSHNPNDKREGYCGRCHDWTDLPAKDRYASSMLENQGTAGKTRKRQNDK